MLLGKTPFAFVAALTMANGVVIQFYSDQNCQMPQAHAMSTITRGKWIHFILHPLSQQGLKFNNNGQCLLNLCSAPTGGFQSYKITAGGGSGQVITAYSPNDCSAPTTNCVSASNVGSCNPAYNGSDGSNADSSSPVCGSAWASKHLTQCYTYQPGAVVWCLEQHIHDDEPRTVSSAHPFVCSCWAWRQDIYSSSHNT